jgi:hypothetical protein
MFINYFKILNEYCKELQIYKELNQNYGTKRKIRVIKTIIRFGYTASESNKKAFPKMEMLFCFIDKSRVFLPIVRLKALIKHKY